MGYENAPDVRGRGPSLGVTVIGLDQRAQQSEPGAPLGVEIADAPQEPEAVREHQHRRDRRTDQDDERCRLPDEGHDVGQGRTGQERDQHDRIRAHGSQRVELGGTLNPCVDLQELLHFFLLKPGCPSRMQTNTLYYTSIDTKSQYTLY